MRRALIGVCLALLVSGCAARSAFRAGREAERLKEYDRAVARYTEAVTKDPHRLEYRQSLERVKLRAAEAHFERGRQHEAAGRSEQAVAEYQLSESLNPGASHVEAALREARRKRRLKLSAPPEGKTELESLIERVRTPAAPGLELPKGAELPTSFVFRSASLRDVYIALARFAGINIVFDPAFRDEPITIDFRDATLEQALDSLSASTRNFYRVTAAKTITIVPDTPAKRREYEQELVRTFYLSNADVKETMDLLRVVVDARKIAPTVATNAFTIQDTPERIIAAERIVSAIDKPRAEVVIDVELLEVNRTRLRELGLQIASLGQPGIAAALGVRDTAINNINQSDVIITSLPGLFLRLLKSDTDTRLLANPQLRTSDGLPAQARFGERVPVPVTTFAPIATGGVAQQPITSFNYENIGVNIDITPRIHYNDEVSLSLKLEVSSIAGTGFGGLPTFGNRSVNTVIRLKDGESNLLAGLIRDEERKTLEGVPGLSDVPGIGRLFSRNKRETLETDVVLMLTPHILRQPRITEQDLRSFRMGRGDSVVPSFEPPPPPREEEAAPARPPKPPL